ncbi:MAG TPA: capsule assembly Wzi family protein [bacterium]
MLRTSKVRSTFLAFIFKIIFVPVLLAQSQNLGVDHWAYSFLDRLETRGLFESETFSARPYSREAIAQILVQINHAVEKDPNLFSPVERRLFEQLKGEFYEEVGDADSTIVIEKGARERHLFTWRSQDVDVRGDGLLGNQSKIESKREVDNTLANSVSYFGLGLRVDVKKSLAIFVEGRTFVLSETDSFSNTVFDPSLGLPVTSEAFVDVAITDNVSSYLVFRLPWLDLEAGRDLIDWGPGYRGNLLLSRNSNYFDLVKFMFRFKKFNFESFHAFLNADYAKYLAGHRLEIRLFRNLYFAVSETVLYGDRDVEFLYFNPFVPILSSERHLGNQDNNMISVDATVFLKNRLKLYSQILMDDFSFAKDIFHNYVNKWGVLVGGLWVDPFGLPDTELRFELTRIQPFVYTHYNEINTYTNYNNVIGHWLGPDSDDLFFEITKQAHKNWRFTLSWEQRRRGEGNDLNNNERPVDDRINFLSGVVERNRYYGLSAQWQAFRDAFFGVNYNFIESKNLQRRENVNQNNHRVFITFSLNH